MSFSTPPPPTPTWTDWWPLYYYVTLVAVFFGLGCFKAHFPPGLGYLILALLVLFMAAPVVWWQRQLLREQRGQPQDSQP